MSRHMKCLASSSVVLLVFLFTTPILTLQSAGTNPANAATSVEVNSFARLENLDERNRALYTEHFYLYLVSYYNVSFRGALLFAHPLNRSETLDLGIWSSYQQNTGQLWSNNETAFFSHRWMWHLFYEGIFPNDKFYWPIVLGSNVSLTAKYLQFESIPPGLEGSEAREYLGSRWAIDPPKLDSLTNPSDEDLPRLGVEPRIYHRCLNEGITKWYLLEMRFSRQPADIQRFTGLFWIPALGLLMIPLVAWTVHLYSARKKYKFRITLGTGLSLYLATALFAFPFILSINQYAPPFQVTIVEWLFYLDALLALLSVVATVFLEYRCHAREANNEKRSTPYAS